MVMGLPLKVPGVGDGGPALGRVVEGHDVLPSSEGAHRQATADYLAQSRHVGRHVEVLLGAPRAVLKLWTSSKTSSIASSLVRSRMPSEKIGPGRSVAECRGHRLHDDAGQLVLMPPDDALAPLQVVVGEHHHVLGNVGRLSGVLRDGRGPVGVQLLYRGPHANLHVLVGAVVPAL